MFAGKVLQKRGLTQTEQSFRNWPCPGLQKEEYIKDQNHLGHFKIRGFGTSLAFQWLRLCASDAERAGLIPGQGTKIPHAVQHRQKKKKILGFTSNISVLERSMNFSSTAAAAAAAAKSLQLYLTL